MRAWHERLGLPANFRYGIGTERELRPVWDSYFAAPHLSGRPESLHTANIWLIDDRGRWRAKYSAGGPVEPRDLAHDLKVLLREADDRRGP